MATSSDSRIAVVGIGAIGFRTAATTRAADQTVTATLTRLAVLAKDNALVAAKAEKRGAFVPMLQAACQQYLRAVEMGFLEADDSQIVQTYNCP